MDKQKVLFVCIHNSARSQMAEEVLRMRAGDRFDIKSAGLEPGTLNPVVVEVLKEKGIDISGKKTQAVFDVIKSGQRFQYVITVCDESSAQRCPIVPGSAQKIHWSFTDPSKFSGTHEEKLAQTRAVYDQIDEKIKEWIETVA